MEKYIDIHSHILPRVDDGSSDMKQTLEMLKIAYRDGVRTVIATPHYKEGRYENRAADLTAVFSNVKEQAKELLPDLKLYLGCEIYYSHESISLLEKGWIPTLAGSKYILVEFSPMKDFKFIKNALQECLFAGYLPILAHVERYQCFQGKTSLVNDLIEMGVYIQINAMSIGLWRLIKLT